MDLWRLPEGKVQQLVDLDTIFTHCVSLIEWPDRLGSSLMPRDYLEVDLTVMHEKAGRELDADALERESSALNDGMDTDACVAVVQDDEFEVRLARLTAYGMQWEERLQTILDESHSTILS